MINFRKADMDKAEGEAMDISHGIPFAKHMRVYPGNYDDVRDAGIVIVTAGANQKLDETRLDLVHKNVGIFKSIIPEIASRDFKGILLIVANPVDILTAVAQKFSGLPENRVIGSGTVLDTGRLKTRLSDHLGDSEIAAFSSANVSGIPLNDFCEMRGHYSHDESEKNIAEEVKNAAYEIIQRKRATYFGVAMAVKRICECIVRDEKSILPVSTMMHGEQGIDGVVLSMPCIVGSDGIETQVPIKLDEDELKRLRDSAGILKGIIEELDI